MKCLLVAFLLVAATSAAKIDLHEKIIPEDVGKYLDSLPKRGETEAERDSRIANGMDAAEGQFPYTLRLTVHDTDGAVFVCSGVLIAADHFLTVRHCFDPVLTFMVTAFAGTVHMNGAGWINRVSRQFWFAPRISGWDPDLAACRLEQPFTITDRIAPIRLPSRAQMNANYLFPQYPINIIGWGRIANGDMASTLQWGRFRIETSCWSNQRPTTMCSVPVDGWHVETRGGDSG
jgi:hypothetical protein